MDWVDENVAVGGWVDVYFSNILKREGIDLIIDARPAFDQIFFRIGRVPDVAKVLRAADLLVALSKMNLKVLVRCHHGKDRSSFVAMVYVSKRYSMGFKDAYDLVKKGRSRTVFHWDWVKMLPPSR